MPTFILLRSTQWRSQYRGKGGQSAPLTAKKIVKNREKQGKSREKERKNREKIEKNRKNREEKAK